MAIEDIGSAIIDFTTKIIPIQGNELSNAEGWTYLFLMVAIIGVGVFVGVRYIVTLQERPKGKYEGEYEFAIANLNKSGANTVTAHISKSKDQFTPKMASDLLRITRKEHQITAEAVDEFKKLLDKTVIFNANVSQFKKDNIIKGNKKAIIISNVDLALEKYYREEGEGSFTITTSSLHKYTRNVQCISAEVVEMGNARGQLTDIYMINVISNDLTEVHDAVLSEDKYKLEVNVFPKELNVEILGRMALFLPTLVEIYNNAESQEDEINRLRDKNDEYLRKNGALHRKLEIAKDRAVRKPVLGWDKPMLPMAKGIAWGWQVITGFFGVLGYYLPQNVESLEQIPEWMLAGLFIVVMVIVRWTFERRKPTEQGANEQNENEGEQQRID